MMNQAEEQARRALQENEAFLAEQEDVEDFSVGIDDDGQICIKVASPRELSEPRKSVIRERIGPEVPVRFKRSEQGKTAY